jgi:hypothetical protein
VPDHRPTTDFWQNWCDRKIEAKHIELPSLWTWFVSPSL